MAIDYKFCDTPQEIYENVILFSDKRELQRPALGNNPIYFVHVEFEGEHLFGLSKFVAFKDIDLEAYIMGQKRKSDGGTTQKHISIVTHQKWVPYVDLEPTLQRTFSLWIHSIFSNYDVNRASLMTIEGDQIAAKIHNKVVTPEQLAFKLKLQGEMGIVGEKIAYRYEEKRLQKKGRRAIQSGIIHTSQTNVAAGYDMVSRFGSEVRYIEVKSSFDKGAPFYLTPREYTVLSSLRDEAFIYRVLIADLMKETGYVFLEIKDPIKLFEETAKIEVALYKVTVA